MMDGGLSHALLNEVVVLFLLKAAALLLHGNPGQNGNQNKRFVKMKINKIIYSLVLYILTSTANQKYK